MKSDYTVTIDPSTKRVLIGETAKQVRMQDNNMAHTLLNVLIKEAFRGNDYFLTNFSQVQISNKLEKHLGFSTYKTQSSYLTQDCKYGMVSRPQLCFKKMDQPLSLRILTSSCQPHLVMIGLWKSSLILRMYRKDNKKPYLSSKIKVSSLLGETKDQLLSSTQYSTKPHTQSSLKVMARTCQWLSTFTQYTRERSSFQTNHYSEQKWERMILTCQPSFALLMEFLIQSEQIPSKWQTY